MKDFWTNLQLFFGKHFATYKLFQLKKYAQPKYGMASQGMDMFNDRYIVQGSDNDNENASFVIFDIVKKKLVAEFQFEIPFHINNINVGGYYNDNSEWPLLYISECKGQHRCFVVNVRNDLGGFDIVQTFIFDSEKHYSGSRNAFDWFIDTKNNFIYTLGNSGTPNQVEVCKFVLPPLRWITRTFIDDEVLDSFFFSCNTFQGSKVIDDMLYVFNGLDTKDNPTQLKVIDLYGKILKDGKPVITKQLDIKGLGEIEAIGKYDDGFIIENCAYNPTYHYLKIKK
jgi:hypothetical protein